MARVTGCAGNRSFALDEMVAHEYNLLCKLFVLQNYFIMAYTKGEALMAAMNEFGLKRAVFFEDDVIDEEAFQPISTDLPGMHIGQDDCSIAAY